MPHLGGGGDQAEVNRHPGVAHQLVQILQILVQLLPGLPVRLLHSVDQGVLGRKIDPVVLLLAGDSLAPGLQGHPEVPADDLVVYIVLGVLHKFPSVDGFQGDLGGLFQISVLQLGKCTVRQDQAAQEHSADKQAEEDRKK